MSLLAIDTALGACSVALVTSGGRAIAASEPMQRGHAERLPVMVRDIFARAGEAPAAITRVVVTTGPGSFTGVRVGLAFSRAVALARGAPCIGVSTLEALAGLGPARRAGAIPAPDGVYFGLWCGDETLAAPAMMPLEDALRLAEGARVEGPAAARFGGVMREACDPLTLAALGAARDPAAAPPAPTYLRAPDAKLPS